MKGERKRGSICACRVSYVNTKTHFSLRISDGDVDIDQ